jgi:hypothetical protein
MSYAHPAKTKSKLPPEQSEQYPGVTDTWDSLRSIGNDARETIWDTMMAPLAGLYQGLKPRSMGGNLSFEEYMQQKKRSRRGYSGRRRAAETNWLIRTSGE